MKVNGRPHSQLHLRRYDRPGPVSHPTVRVAAAPTGDRERRGRFNGSNCNRISLLAFTVRAKRGALVLDGRGTVDPQGQVSRQFGARGAWAGYRAMLLTRGRG